MQFHYLKYISLWCLSFSTRGSIRLPRQPRTIRHIPVTLPLDQLLSPQTNTQRGKIYFLISYGSVFLKRKCLVPAVHSVFKILLIEALVKRKRNCACDEKKLDNLAKRDQQKSSLALGTHYGLSGCFWMGSCRNFVIDRSYIIRCCR